MALHKENFLVNFLSRRALQIRFQQDEHLSGMLQGRLLWGAGERRQDNRVLQEPTSQVTACLLTKPPASPVSHRGEPRCRERRARVKAQAVAVPEAAAGRTGRPHAAGTERHDRPAVSSTRVGEERQEGDLSVVPHLRPLAWWSASRQVSFQAYH